MAARRGLALVLLALVLRVAVADDATAEPIELRGAPDAGAPALLVMLPQPGVPIAAGPKDAVPVLARADNTRAPAAPRPAGAPEDYKVAGADTCLDAGAAKANTAAWVGGRAGAPGPRRAEAALSPCTRAGPGPRRARGEGEGAAAPHARDSRRTFARRLHARAPSRPAPPLRRLAPSRPQPQRPPPPLRRPLPSSCRA
jgi:hypothetical protein